MHSSNRLSFHHALKAVIVLGFAMLIVYLVKTDNLMLYIAPRMADYVTWSAVALYAVGMYELFASLRAWWGRSSDCECGHDHTPSRSIFRNTAVYGLFALPLLLGFLLPNTTLGSSMAEKKGMNLSGASSIRREAPQAAAGTNGTTGTGMEAVAPTSYTAANNAEEDRLNQLFPADKFTQPYADFAKKLYQLPVIEVKEEWYVETLNTVDLYKDSFVGRRMELVGFVYRQDEMSDNQFVVGRFAMQCCSADAAPFGMLMEYDRARQWADDTWVRVSGIIQKTTYLGEEIMVLKVDKVSKLDTPKENQYVYANPEFGL
ncbi:TIGR03943 family putative permease subunit [Paenibacillus chartarius]|uniref:TIGR03943 family putative permease subunit n=1 Tax=Paenibacillus chartarius TaxID=747481 RepID=A0ABV6DF24_9BACL